MLRCNLCGARAVGRLNNKPLCLQHVQEVQAAVAALELAAHDVEDRRLAVEIPRSVLRDREFGPVCWLLSAPFIAKRAWRCVDVDRRRVNWDELLEVSRPWSPSERLFVALARNLWNGEGRFNPYLWSATLDRHNLRRLLEALALAAGRLVIVLDPPEEA